MKLGKISKCGMDNLMNVVRCLNVRPEEVLHFLLENPTMSLKEAECYGIKERKVKE